MQLSTFVITPIERKFFVSQFSDKPETQFLFL